VERSIATAQSRSQLDPGNDSAVGRRERLAKGESLGRWSHFRDQIDPRYALGRRRPMARRNPPQRHIGLHRLEPIPPPAHEIAVSGAVDEGRELLRRLPDRHVQQHHRVVEGLDIGGVVPIAHQAPDEAGLGLRQGVDPVQIVHEVLQDRGVGRRHDPPDIDLGELERRRHQATSTR
jgi:hypothetical protein